MAKLPLKSSSNLPLFSCNKKIFIENVVAFGDAEDILNDEVIKSDGGTIIFTIDVRRQFMPGNYVMNVIGPDNSLDKELHLNYHSAILCREDVDPKLIHDLLIDSNCDRNGRHPELTRNFISRYDWMHFRNWGDDDDEISHDDSTFSDENYKFDDSDQSKESDKEQFKAQFKRSLKNKFNCNLRDLVFFINANRMDDIIAGEFTVEREGESFFVIMNNSLAEPSIGFAIDTKCDAHKFISGDWNYACLLTDQDSNKNFAFVFGDLYVNKVLMGDAPFKYNVQKDKFTYKIENFLYKK